MSSLATYHDDTILDIEEYDIEQLRRIVRSGGVLMWNMNGLWGKLPNAVLLDALRMYDADQAGHERHRRNMGGSEPWWVIHWHQTVTPRDPRAASILPRLRQSQP